MMNGNFACVRCNLWSMSLLIFVWDRSFDLNFWDRAGSTQKRKRQESDEQILAFCFGWMMGIEPTTPGTTIQCSNQLSYNHHFY